MADSTLTNYIKRPSGTISGWDAITLSGESVVVEGNISVQQLYAYLKGIVSIVDPKRLRGIEKTVLQHIQDHNNPHQDKLSMFVDDIVAQILRQVVPGTSPKQFPALSYIAELELPDEITVVSIARNSSITVFDRQGFFTTADVNVTAVDWASGIATIPLFPKTTQTIPVSDVTSTGNISLVGMTSSTGGVTGLKTPNNDSNFLTLFETADDSEHGFTITAPVAKGTEYTTSVMMVPANATGFIVVTLGDDTSKYVLIDLTNKTIVGSTDGSLIGHLQILPNGWWRIGVQYVAQTDGVQSVLFLYSTDGTPGSTYTGSVGNPLFSLFCIQNTTSAGLCPILKDSASVLEASVLTIPLSSSPVAQGVGTIAASYYRNKCLLETDTSSPQLIVDTGVGVSIKAVNGTVTANIDVGETNPVVFTQTLASDTEVTSALSYSSKEIAFKSTGNERNTLEQGYNQGSTLSTFTFGPFHGGLARFAYYAIPDTDQVLEFLVGEN